MVLSQTFIDILNINNGIIHKTSYGNAHATQGHCVYFHAKEINGNE